MHNLLIRRNKITESLILVALCFCLYFISKQNYVLFHTISELTLVVLGFTLMLIALGTIKIGDNSYFHIVAINFGFISFIELLHILSFEGINAFSNDSNMSVQLTILAKYYGCIMLNASILYGNKKINMYKLIVINILFTIISVSSIIVFKIFPVCYIEGYGVTLFHQISEVIFSISLLFVLFAVIKGKIYSTRGNKIEIAIGICFQIASFITYLLCDNISGVFCMIGHILNFIAYYFAFKATFKVIVVNPYNVLFKSLKNKVEQLESINKELIQANNKAQRMEQLNEKVINLIPDGILVLRNRKIASANNRLLNMLEITDEQKLINMDFTEIIDTSYHEIFELRVSKMDRRILERPQEYEFVWGEKKKWVEITSLIVDDESGEYIISAIRNIEDRKKAEEAEQLLKLKEKEENMKNEFFSNISHELRTPINVIYAALQVENDLIRCDTNKETITKYNKIIRQNCLRLTRLVNNIIDITRIESSFFKPVYNIENIVFIVEDITMSIVEYVNSKKIKLIFDTEVEEAYVKCDSDLIERIILNILSNSVKYGKEGGNIEVYIYQSNEHNISILIKDDGIGIPDEMKHKIFNRFLKIDNSLSRKTEGSGIGLSLVKQLVEVHNGTITFNSKVNQGTEFLITFPIIKDYSEACTDLEKSVNYPKNIIKSAEIEFSDIYYY